jgi:hypothetical protein
MNLVTATIATCLMSSLMYAAYPAPDLVAIVENGQGYTDRERAEMETFVSMQIEQVPVEFYLDEAKAKKIAALFNASPEAKQ